MQALASLVHFSPHASSPGMLGIGGRPVGSGAALVGSGEASVVRAARSARPRAWTRVFVACMFECCRVWLWDVSIEVD